ncbi:hypothetical protein C8J56DRAFT_915468 [Mycena floridula]|nr:hypothetical protein C8J56DRAFT_915468 [Mycena floridula]
MFRTRTRTASAASESPPASPKLSLRVYDVANIFVKMRRSRNRVKAKTAIESSSGAPQSHPGLADAVIGSKKELLQLNDVFICMGAVNVATLLRATRGTLMEMAENLGANVLLDERWTCAISQRQKGAFRVQIRYQASAARSAKPDPHRPVALEQAKGVPGLMTIVKRNES